ncbi:hypothetical protein SAMD00019534_010460, partial [Acytostelium subglobosum LB1]|uniref:hypothetical protein n=1 Tax=Acytostelium subglobosum LB1 TaxID=1410327 RepID=UPI0006450C6E
MRLRNSMTSLGSSATATTATTHYVETEEDGAQDEEDDQDSRLLRTSAQEAYRNKDVAKSKAAHRKIDDEPHKSNAFKKGSIKYLKSGIGFGSYAILFCIAIVIGLEALFNRFNQHNIQQQQNADNNLVQRWTSGHDWDSLILYITTVILTGSGVALAFIESHNKRVDINFYESEKKRETWEYDNYVEGEQREMVELYCKKGMNQDDAVVVVDLLSKYRDLFVDIMMAEELNLIPVELHLSPMETGLTAMISFLIFGLVPLTPFFFSHLIYSELQRNIAFPLFILIVELELFLIGALKSKFYVGTWWGEGLISAWNGVVSILVSLVVGHSLG